MPSDAEASRLLIEIDIDRDGAADLSIARRGIRAMAEGDLPP